MLSAVTSTRAAVPVLLASAALLAACTSTTSGTGRIGNGVGLGSTSPSAGPHPAASSRPAHHSTSPSLRPSSVVHPPPANPLRTATVHAPDGATYVVEVWASVSNSTCADHAYGRTLISFLTRHPCQGMQRLLATTSVHGRAVGFAETATSFTGAPDDPYVYSSRFRHLELANGTGSINDLLREGYRLPSGPSAIPGSEAFNVIGQDNGVTVWDAWYLHGSTPNNDKALMKMTTDLFLQF
jgi:hypothetical protein